MSLFSYAVLSLDGGGIRGIIPCMVLQEIEERSGRPISDLFDLMAGTSTGGILAAGLAIADEKGQPQFSAKKLLGLYTGKNGKKIFKKPLPGFLNYFRLLFKSLFPPTNIEAVLKTELGDDIYLKDIVSNTELFITSYDTQLKRPFYFRSRVAREKEEDNFLITQIARSTSAAPTYFPPNLVPYNSVVAGKPVKNLGLIDGGVFANNPSVLAYVEAMQMFKETKEYQAAFKTESDTVNRDMEARVKPDNFAPPILLISIGTGQTEKPYMYAQTKGWGLRWLMPLIDILMQGVSESVHYQMEHLLPPYLSPSGDVAKRYYRLNIPIGEAYSDMSDVSDNNLEQLQEYGREIIKKYSKDIDKIVDELNALYTKRELKDF